MLKGMNGITLISLVVTIIVLIILAAVTINLLLGQNGIITKTSEATEAMKIATIKEQIEMDILGAQIGTYEKITLLELQEKGIIDGIVDGIGVITRDGYVFTVVEKEDGSFEITLIGKEGEITISAVHSINPETATSKVEITVRGTYLAQGIKEIEKPDGSKEPGGTNTRILVTTYEVTVNGIYTFKIIGNDNQELEYKVTITNIDTDYPSATHTTSPEEGIWGTSVEIMVIGTDNQGIGSIERPNGTIVTTNQATYTVTANGEYTFKIKDTSNNVTNYVVIVENIDREGPNLTYTLDPNPPTQGANVTINLNATDSKSGVKSITLPDNNTVTTNSATYTVIENGVYTFAVKDNLDNQTTESITITNIDNTTPTGTVSYNPTTPTSGSVFATITTNKEIQTPNGGWIRTDVTHYTKEYTENWTGIVTITDLVNNTETVSIDIRNIDKQPPSAPSFGLTREGTTITVTNPTATDAGGSGVAKFLISIDGVTWQDFAVNPTFSGTEEVNTYTVSCKAVDFAGNESGVSTQESVGSGSCITAETPIATGMEGQTRKAGELMEGDEILSFNSLTGEFELRPIIYITKTKVENKSIANLKFSDETNLRIYNGHRLFNVEKGSYPNIDVLNVDSCINMNYYKINFADKGITILPASLVGYNLENYSGYVYDFITENNLNYFANQFATCSVAMISLPFTYYSNRPLVINYEEYLSDIETYGLITYEECIGFLGIEIPRFIFDGMKWERMLIAIKKGYLSPQAIEEGLMHLGRCTVCFGGN